MKKEFFTRTDYCFKLFDKKSEGLGLEMLDLEMLETYQIPKWLRYLILTAFVVGIMVVPIPYKIMILILLIYIFGILF